MNFAIRNDNGIWYLNDTPCEILPTYADIDHSNHIGFTGDRCGSFDIYESGGITYVFGRTLMGLVKLKVILK